MIKEGICIVCGGTVADGGCMNNQECLDRGHTLGLDSVTGVSLEEYGAECETCEGTGNADDTCSLCTGTGIGQHGDPDTSICSQCRGKGTIRPDFCGDCDGEGKVTREMYVRVSRPMAKVTAESVGN
jgi:DnaJ-class molecular chaperone